MERSRLMAAALGLLLGMTPMVVAAAEGGGESWLDTSRALAAKEETKKAEAPPAEPTPKKGNCPCAKWLEPPDSTFVPLHNFEAYSGGAITPVAYIINQDHEGFVGLPSLSFSYVCFADDPTDDAYTFAVTMPFLNRFEFGYSISHLDIGDLFHAAKRFGADIGRGHVLLHTFSLRGNIIRDEQFCPYNPALTAGVHFKMNEGIFHVDQSAFGTLKEGGMSRRCGTDFTLVASKRIPDLLFERPLFVSAGIRFTNAAHTGMMGFRSDYACRFESNVFYKPFDWLTLGYEFRQKRQMLHNSDFSEEMGRLAHEENWHLFTVALQVTKSCQVTALLGGLGTVGLQAKWDF
jgi:hypothetical protein